MFCICLLYLLVVLPIFGIHNNISDSSLIILLIIGLLAINQITQIIIKTTGWVEIDNGIIKRSIFGHTVWDIPISTITDITPIAKLKIFKEIQQLSRIGLIIKADSRYYRIPHDLKEMESFKTQLKSINPNIKNYSLMSPKNSITEEYKSVYSMRNLFIGLSIVVVCILLSWLIVNMSGTGWSEIYAKWDVFDLHQYD